MTFTSLTTFAGLAPLIFERSVQARFLIPMALSLGFGVLFATAITLVLIPGVCDPRGSKGQKTGGRKPPVLAQKIRSRIIYSGIPRNIRAMQ